MLFFGFSQKATLRCGVIRSSSLSDFDIPCLMEGLSFSDAHTPPPFLLNSLSCSISFIALQMNRLNCRASLSLSLFSVSVLFCLPNSSSSGLNGQDQKQRQYMWLRLHHSGIENRCIVYIFRRPCSKSKNHSAAAL